MYSDYTDDELLREIRRGNGKAFEVLAVRYQDVIYRLALRQLNDRETAEEVVQEVFLRAWKKLRRWSFRRGKPFTWLYRTTQHVCSEFRRQARRCPLLSADFRLECVAAATVEQAELEHEEMTRQVQRLVRDLPSRQEEVVVLHVFEQLRLQDVAAVLGIPVGTVKSNYHKALVNLRKMAATTELAGRRACKERKGTGT